MPRKKSVKRAAADFTNEVTAIEAFVARHVGTPDKSWTHEYAVLRLYREFERLMLEVLVGAVNNDTTTLSSRAGVKLPKHLTDDVCEFLIVGDGYFDFRGRDGLIKTVRQFVPDTHYLLTIIKESKYKEPLERLSALRNYAAHDSAQAKQRARAAVGQAKIMCAGDWLCTQSRLLKLAGACRSIAQDIHAAAPY